MDCLNCRYSTKPRKGLPAMCDLYIRTGRHRPKTDPCTEFAPRQRKGYKNKYEMRKEQGSVGEEETLIEAEVWETLGVSSDI